MTSFLPAKRVAEITQSGLHRTIMAASADLLRRVVLPVPSHKSGK